MVESEETVWKREKEEKEKEKWEKTAESGTKDLSEIRLHSRGTSLKLFTDKYGFLFTRKFRF